MSKWNEISDPMTQLNDVNLKKYRKAGHVAAIVLDKLVNLCKPGAIINELCKIGDQLILEEVKKVYPELGNSRKGIAFPCTISINNVVGHFIPLDSNIIKIKDGDLVKIQFGVHIDGFPAMIAYTVFVKENTKGKVGQTIKQSNILKALREASKEIYKNMKPGKTNFDIRDILQNIAKKYNLSLPYVTSNDERVPGVQSFQISRFILDGYNDDNDKFIHRLIMPRYHDSYDFTMVKTELEENEVYAIDIIFCTGTGKLSKIDCPYLVNKRILEKKTSLKLKYSKNALKIFKRNRFPINIKNEYNARFKFGLNELIQKRIVEHYPVMGTKSNEICGRLMFTVVVKNNPILIIGRSLDKEILKTEI